MLTTLIKNAQIVNEGEIWSGDVLINGERIEKIAPSIDTSAQREIDATGQYLLPGLIDDHVHFREPGLTHKGDLTTESRAAVAGGVTSFMEMPNTKPPATTQERLQKKYERAAEVSLANYSFYMGTSTKNLEEVRKTDPETVCGIKIYMGSSTGDMLVDDPQILSKIFKEAPTLVATHCEDEATIQKNWEKYRKQYGNEVPLTTHPKIRDVEACYRSSKFAVELARKHETRLHIVHLTTGRELELLSPAPVDQKQITAEVCPHHLWFSARDYEKYEGQIMCYPAIKSEEHRNALWEGLSTGKIDLIGTDHAPHTWEEKQGSYQEMAAGIPLVQHSLNMMLMFHHREEVSLEMIVQKMCHAPAECFRVRERGYIREGYFADLILVEMNQPWMVRKENIYQKCGWSPFEGEEFSDWVTHTFVNGHLAYQAGRFDDSKTGQRLLFER